MSKELYQKYMKQSEECASKALAMKHDENLAKFWHNASIGFRMKALKVEGNANE